MTRHAALAMVTMAAGLSAAAYAPARFRTGTLPGIPFDAVGGGEVFVEVEVGQSGRVTGTSPVRITAPFTDYVLDAVRDWQFTPAKDGLAVPSTVMVAAVFRPQVLQGPTLGTRPSDVGRPSSSVPAPVGTPMPPFPANAHASGVVLLEVLVAATGAVENARVVRSAPPFDDAAQKTVRLWKFEPAQRGGVTVPAIAYVIFAFRPPV
jgi:TonB family protein